MQASRSDAVTTLERSYEDPKSGFFCLIVIKKPIKVGGCLFILNNSCLFMTLSSHLE